MPLLPRWVWFSGRTVRSVVLAWAVVSAAFGGAFVSDPAQARTGAGTATEDVPVLAAPDEDAAVLIMVPKGATVVIAGRARDGFYPVDFAGIDGWTPTGYVALSVDDDAALWTALTGQERGRAIATDGLNLRAGPSTAEPVLAVIPAGDAVTLTGDQEAGFLEIVYAGTTGWADGEYLAAARPQPTHPPRQPRAPSAPRDPRTLTEAEIIRYIYDAADYYGQPREDMLRVAMCESDLVPTAVNAEGGSYGIFQFKTGTWLSTPYADYDIFDPRASAYAAAWMWSVGRRNEWVCQ